MTQNTQTTRDRLIKMSFGICVSTDALEAFHNAIAAEIDRLTAERDEARAEVATLTLKLANARLNLKHCSEEVDKRDECAGQLAEARTAIAVRDDELELKRIAWEGQRAAYEATINQLAKERDSYKPADEYMRLQREMHAARARAAKEAKP